MSLKKLGLWAARALTTLGAILVVGGFLVLGFFWPGSISDPVFAGMLIVLDLVSIFEGLILIGTGVMFQKMKHDEWSLGGYQLPRGRQVKCVRCGGLMNADTTVCPFCGKEATVEPVVWSKMDPATSQKTEVPSRSSGGDPDRLD